MFFFFKLAQFYSYTLLKVLIFKIGHKVGRCLQLAIVKLNTLTL